MTANDALRPVSPDYDPGYPEALASAELRALLADPAHGRCARLALAALALSAPAGAAQQDERDREAEVLALLRGLLDEVESGYYPRASFPSEPGPGAGTNVVLPRVPILFGNSLNGVFDGARARELAREAFEAYGIELAADHAVDTEAGAAVLDGFDSDRKLGFELRGTAGRGGFGPLVVDEEPPERGLSDAELRALEQDGAKVHVADLKAYPLADQDQFTPLLAYLAGVVDFLNAATGGPDVDLTAILFRREQVFALPAAAHVAAPEGVTAADVDSRLRVTTSETATLRLAFSGPGDPPPILRAKRGAWHEPGKDRPLERPLSTAGAPTALLLEHSSEDHGWRRGATMRLVQEGQGGGPGVDVRGAAFTLFAPSAFDAARPFTLEVTLEPGTHVLGRELRIGAPER